LSEQSEQTLTPDEAAAQFESLFFGLAERLEMDDKGRIPLPRLLMESAHMEPGMEVVIVGAKNRLEIRKLEDWKTGLRGKFKELPALVARMEASRAANGESRKQGR